MERFKFSQEILDFYKDYSFVNLKNMYFQLDKSNDKEKYFLMSAVLFIYCKNKYKFEKNTNIEITRKKDLYSSFNVKILLQMLISTINRIDCNPEICIIN